MTERWAVLTDLDGTLLDHDSYDWRPAEPALRRLRQRGIPVVAVTSKTRAELAGLLDRIPWLSPVFGCENGALICDRRGGSETVEILGTPTETLIRIFDQACARTGCAGLGFHQVSDRQVADWTGLALDQAGLARRREASLPVYWPPDAPGKAAFIDAVERAGARVLVGGRFLHLGGVADKGLALDRLRVLLGDDEPCRILALGDSGNDDAMLAAADIGIRIPPARGPEGPEPVANARRAPEPGPRGWNKAVLQWLDQPFHF